MVKGPMAPKGTAFVMLQRIPVLKLLSYRTLPCASHAPTMMGMNRLGKSATTVASYLSANVTKMHCGKGPPYE